MHYVEKSLTSKIYSKMHYFENKKTLYRLSDLESSNITNMSFRNEGMLKIKFLEILIKNISDTGNKKKMILSTLSCFYLFFFWQNVETWFSIIFKIFRFSDFSYISIRDECTRRNAHFFDVIVCTKIALKCIFCVWSAQMIYYGHTEHRNLHTRLFSMAFFVNLLISQKTVFFFFME